MALSLDVGIFAKALADLPAEDDDWGCQRARGYLYLDAGCAWSGKISQWRKLLHHPFDKVTLLISDADQKDGITNATQAEKYRNVVSILRGSLEEMMDNIGSDWLSFQRALDFEVIGEEYNPPAHYFNKDDEYDSTPKRKWYRSAKLLSAIGTTAAPQRRKHPRVGSYLATFCASLITTVT